MDKTKAYEYQSPQDLQYVLQQIHDFLIYEQQYCESFEKLSHWLNYQHNEKYMKGISCPGRLVLAKYLNDPNYDQLVQAALPYARDAFEHDYKNLTLEGLYEKVNIRYQNLLIN